jgi:hypothetical protein
LQARFFEFFEEFHAGFARHDDVGKDEVEALGLEEFGGTVRVIADGSFMSGQAESASERCKGVCVVVDEEEMSFAWHEIPFTIPSAQTKIGADPSGARASQQQMFLSRLKPRPTKPGDGPPSSYAKPSAGRPSSDGQAEGGPDSPR